MGANLTLKINMLQATEKDKLDVINFTNVDSRDYEGMFGGEVTIIKSGETKPFPRFLAYHYAKHLINKMLLAGSGDYGDELQRKALEDRILGNVSVPATTTPSVSTPPDEGKTEDVVSEDKLGKENSEIKGFVGSPEEKENKTKVAKPKKIKIKKEA